MNKINFRSVPLFYMFSIFPAGGRLGLRQCRGKAQLENKTFPNRRKDKDLLELKEMCPFSTSFLSVKSVNM